MFKQNPVITFHNDFAYSARLEIPYQKKRKKTETNCKKKNDFKLERK